jgi:hypothetical protein
VYITWVTGTVSPCGEKQITYELGNLQYSITPTQLQIFFHFSQNQPKTKCAKKERFYGRFAAA